VAQALYKYMLRLVHTVWSRNSYVRLFVRHRRQLYPCPQHRNDTTSIHSDLSFKCSVIDEERAVALGLTEARALTSAYQKWRYLIPWRRSAWGIEHRGDLTVDDVVDSAPKWRTIHWRCTKSLTNLWTRCASSRRAHWKHEMTANFRMWSRESGRDLFLSTSNYMDKRFGKTRIPVQISTLLSTVTRVSVSPKTHMFYRQILRFANNSYTRCAIVESHLRVGSSIWSISSKTGSKEKTVKHHPMFKSDPSRHTWKTTSSRPMYTCRQMSGKRGKDTGCEAEGGRPSSPTRINDI
jgi:hypothetical protein